MMMTMTMMMIFNQQKDMEVYESMPPLFLILLFVLSFRGGVKLCSSNYFIYLLLSIISGCLFANKLFPVFY